VSSGVCSFWSELVDEVPDLTCRKEWFTYWDDLEHGGSGSGKLNVEQVKRALGKTFTQFEKKALDAAVSEMWVDFDEDKSGVLDENAIMKPQLGFVDTVHMLMLWSR